MTKKKSPNKIDEVQLIVTAERYLPETLFMRNAVGDGNIGDQKVEVSQSMQGAPIIRIGDGNWYVFPLQPMVEAVNEAEKEYAKANC